MLALILAQALSPPPLDPLPDEPVRQVPAPILRASQNAIEITRIGNWAIRADRSPDQGCFGYAAFADGSAVRVTNDPAGGGLRMIIVAPRAQSLEASKAYPVKVHLRDFGSWASDAEVIALTPRQKALAVTVSGQVVSNLEAAGVFELTHRGEQVAWLRMRDLKGVLSRLAGCQGTATQEAVTGQPAIAG